MVVHKTNLFKRMEQLKDQLNNVTKQTTLHDPQVVRLSQELDRLILQFYKK